MTVCPYLSKKAERAGMIAQGQLCPLPNKRHTSLASPCVSFPRLCHPSRGPCIRREYSLESQLFLCLYQVQKCFSHSLTESQARSASNLTSQPRKYTEASAVAGLNIQRVAAIISKTMLFMTQQRAVAKAGLQLFMSVQ